MSKYIKEDLEVMLRNHKKNEAKLTELELKLEEYEELLKYAGTVYQTKKDEAIENLQLNGKGYGIEHFNTNKISDKVFSTVLNYSREENYINKENRCELEKKIENCKEKKAQLTKIVVRVKNIINQLSEDEKFIIESFYMKKAKWDYLEKSYFDEFEIHKSIKQLQTYRDNALNSMLDVLNTGG